MPSSSELNFKTAVSLLEEVSAQIETFKQSIDQHNASLADSGSGVLGTLARGLKGKFTLSKERNALLQKCEQAISLATSIRTSNPDIALFIKRDGEDVEITPDNVIGHSHLSKGVINYVDGSLQVAKQCFIQSVKVFPTADGQIRLSHTMLALGELDEAVIGFQQVVDNYPDTEESIDANKVLLHLKSIPSWRVSLFKFLRAVGYKKTANKLLS